MSVTRAKFTCVSIEENKIDGGNVVKLQPVVSGSVENEQFFNFTPWGDIQLGIVNPNVKFEEGVEYYVDFTKATA